MQIDELAMYAFTAFWFLSGLAFWIGAMRFDGIPTTWRTGDHYRAPAGWDQWLTINLLISLIGGPLWWIAMWACRRVQ